MAGFYTVIARYPNFLISVLLLAPSIKANACVINCQRETLLDHGFCFRLLLGTVHKHLYEGLTHEGGGGLKILKV